MALGRRIGRAEGRIVLLVGTFLSRIQIRYLDGSVCDSLLLFLLLRKNQLLAVRRPLRVLLEARVARATVIGELGVAS